MNSRLPQHPTPSPRLCACRSIRRIVAIVWLFAFIPDLGHAAAGDLDTTFGGGTGKVTTDVGSNDAYARGVALQSDGKIVVAGHADIGTRDFAVVRYNASGTLDITFNGSGKVFTPIGGSYDEAYAVTVQSDGKIIAAGWTRSGSSNDNFAVVRYNTDGTLDTSFSGDGKQSTDFGTNQEYATSVALQSDGKIVLAGDCSNDFALARYNADGSLDTSFGSGGKVITDLGTGDTSQDNMTIQSDGKILLTGRITNPTHDFLLVRYNSDGSLDASFGEDGKVITPVGSGDDFGRSVVVQSNGKILVAGDAEGGALSDFAVVCYNGDGTLDSSFGSGGKVITQISSSHDRAYDMALQSDGKIILAGYSGSNSDFALVRYNGDGTLDTGFGSGGKVTIPIGSSTDEAYSVVLQSNGRIVMAGESWDGSEYDFAVVRLLGDPSPPEINLSGNGGGIVDGDLTPSTSDHTDFSTAEIIGGTVTRTFTIQNTGETALTLGSVTVSGTDATDFIVSAQPATPVTPSGSTTFQVIFNPNGPGVRSATLSFSSNDGDEGAFDFAIQGIGTGFPSSGQLIRPGNLSTGLRAWWKMDEASGTRMDASGTGNHLASQNNVGSAVEDYWVTGERSADLESSSSQYLSITDAAQTGLGMTSTYTFSAWIKMESINDFMPIAGKTVGTNGYAFLIRSSGDLAVNHGTGVATFSAGLAVGKWQHVVVVYDDPNDKLSCYVDGNLKGVAAVTTNPPASTDFFGLGKHNADGIYFDGMMKDVAVWERPLTSVEVKSLASGIDVSTTYRPGNVTVAPTAWWKLNELSSGSSAVTRSDSAGAHPLADTNTVGSGGGYLEGAAADFIASNSELMSAADSADWTIGSGDASFATWVRFDVVTAGTPYPIFGHSQDGSNFWDLFLEYGGGQHSLMVHQAVGGSFNLSLSVPWAPSAGTWYHVAWVKQGSQHRLYVDGQMLGTAQSSGTALNDFTGPVMIGRKAGHGSMFIDGRLADVAFWKGYALSATEIKALATALPVQKSGIVSYWPLDEASGTRADGVGSNHLSSVNTVSNGTGVVGNAADFEADSSQYLSITDAAQSGLDITQNLTAIAWVKPESSSALTFVDKTGNDEGYSLNTSAGSAYFLETNGATVISTTLASAGSWQHVVGVWDGARKSIWVDSRMENSSVQTAGPNNTTTDFFLGRHNSIGSRYWDGLLDEVVVAKRSFRDEEVKAIYLRGLNGLNAMPVPDIVIEQPVSTDLVDGVSTVDFGGTTVASVPVTKTFTIRNSGELDLTSLAVTKSGANSGDFTVNTTGMSTTLTPGESTTFSVNFVPLQAGGRSVNIHIASNDLDENPFDITLTGAGNLTAAFTSKSYVPVISNGFTATGSTVNLTLNYAPTTGDELLVVNNTSLDPINGTFSNLANGQTVTLSYGGVNYDFVAYYYGGEGYNDLVLLWKNRRLVAWGYNNSGQLGDNSIASRNSPVLVNNTGGTSALAGKDIVSITTGGSHSLALCTDGTVLAWGHNGAGQLGDNTTAPSQRVPVVVNAASGVSALFGKRVVALAAGTQFSAALCADGTVATWGRNDFGQLGNGTSGGGTATKVPGAVSTASGQSALFGKRVAQISLGFEYCLALTTDGTLVSWGSNTYGSLGDGSQTHRYLPVLIDTGSGTSALFGKTVKSVAAGETHSLALCTDGVLTSWGNYGSGMLGDNSDNIFRTSPVLVNRDQGLSALYNKSVAMMAGGSSHTVALCTDGTMTAWGSNLATLVGATDSLVPAFVNASTNGSALIGVTPVSIYAGYRYSLALCTNGTIVSWGTNTEGQLGTGQPGNPTISVPVLVSTASLTYGERFVAAATDARSEHSLAIIATPPPFPEVSVNETASGELEDAVGAMDFGTTLINTAGATKTFTIQNIGGADLTGLNVTKSGANASEYVLGSLGATTLVPGGSTTFTVTFMPTVVGTRIAAIQIASNDGDENPFDIALTGTASGTLTAAFAASGDIPLTSNGFTATGSTVNLTLSFAPSPFSTLTVVNNTSVNPITGTFTNLAQGQTVTLSFGGTDYRFFADYFGGTGNDLVLVLHGPGVLDYSFNGSGKVKTAIGSGNEQARAVAVQPDGKVVAVGHTQDDFAVVRYNVDGSLDSSFGTGGKVTTAIGTETDEAHGVAVQADGKIVVVGFAQTSGVRSVAVVRYNSNGTLDTSFDGDGKAVSLVAVAGGEGRDVVLQSDGKIVVGADHWSGTDTDFALLRFNTNGSLDTSFGAGGIVTTAQAGRHDEATCVALAPDGKIVLGGYYQLNTDYVIELARYQTNGTLDTTFSGDGIVTTQLGAAERANDVIVQPDGKIVLVGQGPGGGGNDGIVLRYNLDGTLDTSFDSDGIVGLTMGGYGDYSHGVALQWDGKILVAGITEDGVAANMMLARFLANGTLDTSFGGTGLVSTSLGATSSDFAHAMALTPDGRIVLAGLTTVDGTWDFAAARFLVETERQVTFTSAGTVPFTAPAFAATGQTVDITLGFVPTPGQVLTLVNNTGSLPISGAFTNLADGAVISPAYNGISYPFRASYTGGTGNDLTLTALAGALDATFSTDGIVTTAVGGAADVPYGVAEQSDGKIVAVGLSFNGSNNDFAVLRYLADGSLDGSFGTGGKVTTAIGGGDDTAVHVSLQNDGKIVVSGWSHNGSNNDYALVRYNANGTLDTSFNGTGKVTTPIGSSDDTGGRNVIQSDGKIVVSGWSDSGGNINFALVRYNSNGSLDTSFNGTGKVTTDFSGGQDVSNGVVVQNDGKILAAGTIPGSPFGMARYNADGSLDASFGSGGKVTTTVSGGGQGNSVALQSDGKIVCAGYNNPGNAALIDFVVLRYNTDGSLDTSFDGDGKVITDVGGNTDEARKVMIQNNGKIVVAGGSLIGANYAFSLVRYHTSGSLDLSFGGTGMVTTAIGSGSDYGTTMGLQSDGKILVVGQSHNGSNNDFALARYLVETNHEAVFASAADVPLNSNGFTATGQTLNLMLDFAPIIGTELMLVNNTSSNPISGTFTNLANGVTVPLTYNSVTYNFIANYTGGTGNDLTLLLPGPGALDYTFNGSGKTTTGFGAGNDGAHAVVVQPDGKIVAVGASGNYPEEDFALARYHANGALDTSFNGTGKITLGLAQNDVLEGVALQSDGKIVAVGYTGATTPHDFAVLRYNSDGTPDTSFNGNGRVITAVGSGDDLGYGVVVQTDGKIVVAGAADSDFAVVRYNTNGSLDTSFNGTGMVTTSFVAGYESGTSLVLQSDGKIVAAGYAHNGTNYDFAVVRFHANGTLDTGFNGTGKVITSIGSGNDQPYFVAIQTNGKILLAGFTTNGSVDDAALVRYNTDGSLDTSFGGTGKIVTAIGTGDDAAHSLALTLDGKILAGGYATTNSNADFALLRYNTNGTLDSSFGNGGKIITAIGSGNDKALGMAVQADGGIVLAGSSFNGVDDDFAMVRYQTETTHDVTFAAESSVPLNANGFTATVHTVNISLGFAPSVGAELRLVNNTGSNPITGTFTNIANGATVPLVFNTITYNFIANYSGGTGNDLTLLLPGPGALDYTFNGSGRVTTVIGGSLDYGNTVTVQSDGKALVAGYAFNGANNDFAVTRYNTDGSLDTSFGGTGKVVTSIGVGNDEAQGVAVQSDRKIIVAGHASNGSDRDFVVVRYHPGGSLDTSFNGTGKVVLPIGSGEDLGNCVVLQADGRIIVAGYAFVAGNADFALARLNTNGTLDTTFNGNGIATAAVSASHDVIRSVVMQGDGKIVVSGYSTTGGQDFAVARFLPSGALDTTFNTTGTVTTSFGPGDDVGQNVAVLPDGRLLVGGYASIGGNNDLALARYTATGALDTTFGSGGMVTTAIGGGHDVGSMAVQADGRIVMAGFGFGVSNYDVVLARYLANGSLDTSFRSTGKAIFPVGDGEDYFNSLAFQSDGKILVAGSPQIGGVHQFGVLRLLNDTTHAVAFNSAADVPLNANGFTASGQTLNLTLGFMPDPGTSLKVINNTALSPISGEFVNLAHGQAVTLNYSGTDYSFVANFFDGDGNDLVLEWAYTRLLAWGNNGDGNLGINSTTSQLNLPTAVTASAAIYGKTTTGVSAGNAHSLAVASDGTVAAWGYNGVGQLGNGGTTTSLTPVAVNMAGVLAGKKVVAVSAGWMHSMALCSDGTVAAWGHGGYGQLGNNSTLNSPVPVLVNLAGVLAGKRVVAVAAGFSHSAALCSDGTVVCWGDNDSKQLGDGGSARSPVPVAVVTSGVLLGKTVVAIAAGYSHTLARCSDGTVVAWGSNANKQLGNNSTANSNLPVAVDTAGVLNGKFVTQIAAGGDGSMVICSDGTVAAWGSNDRGQVGNNTVGSSYGTPQAVDLSTALSGKTITGIGAGFRHGLAVCADGSMSAWGSNVYGQLGINSVVDSQVPVTVLTSMLDGTERFVAATGGCYTNHVLAIVGTTAPEPMIVVEQPAGTSIADGSSQNYGTTLNGTTKTRTFIIKNTGTATLGGIDITITGSAAAQYALTTSPATSVAPGDSTSFTLAFTPISTGPKPATLRIANNVSGTLNPFDITLSGLGSAALPLVYTTGAEVPATANGFTAGGKSVTINAATLNYAPVTGTRLMVVNNTGTGFISGAFSNLAHGQVVPLTYNSITYNFIASYYGGTGNDLVLHWAGNRLLAWGTNSSGTFGNNSTASSNVPMAVDMSGVLSGKTVVAVAAAEHHSLALCTDGTLAAWGANNAGQLGDDTTTNRLVPVLVNTTTGVSALFGKTVVAIAAGYDFSMALCSDGSVATWGVNSVGQLGDNSTTDRHAPVLVNTTGVLAGKSVTTISAGLDFCLAQCADGTAAAWGANSIGQLGNDSTTDSAVPVAVSMAGVLAGKSVTAVAAGHYHGLALCTDGTLAAWGDNTFGELGNNSTEGSAVPVQVSSGGPLTGKTPVSVAAGQFHSLALCADGTLVTWGDNTTGQLGLNGITESHVPVVVTSSGVLAGKMVSLMTSGQSHSMVSLTDGTLAAWGDNALGQIGDGTTTGRFLPVAINTTALAAGERITKAGGGATASHSMSIVAMPLASGGAPVVSTNAAESINKTSATLKGLVNPSGTATTAYFEYGLTTSYGSVIPGVPQSVGSGSASQTVTQPLTGLEPNTPYHFRIVASNTNGTVVGDDFSFVTLQDPPVVITSGVNPNNITNTTAILPGTVNPNGRATTVYFEFGLTDQYGNTTAPQNLAAGSSNVNVTAPVSGLTLGTTYHFRIVAENNGGTAHGEDAIFTTTSISAPTLGTVSASGFTTTGATLNGSVNPNGAITNAFFEYGLTTTYTNVTGTTGIAAGTSAVNVALPVSALAPGTLYHYRLVTENSAGITRSGDATFTTLPLPPIVETLAATPLSTTSTRLHGTVRAQNGTAVVTFEYGTDGVNFPNSLTATPSPVTGDAVTNVSVDLTNLLQFTTYHFRVRAVSSGGNTPGGILTFQPQVISGLLQQFPNAPPASNGTLTVTLAPTGLLSGWRFVGEHRWRASGETATGLVHGSRVIEFRPVPGYLQPGTDSVNVTAAGQVADYEYYATPSAGSGGIHMVLKPDTLAQAVNETDRGQWRLLGETTWRDSATTASSLPAGSYLVECKAVSGYSTPVLVNIVVSSGQTVNPTIVYADAFSPTGTPPSVLTFSTVSTDATKPYGYVGQIRSHSGLGTGFAVKQRVVATAGHVVFDEGTLASVQGLQWLPQADAGGHEPLPVTPRGYYLIDGYATQRATETPGSFSLASRQKDVAALYFVNDTDAARTGFAGFLASDLTNNEFLISNAQKMLVGYPVDGIAAPDQGRMHATPAANLSFTGLTDRVFATIGVRSTGGNSGGPLCVQHTNGNWYPAAIYLGGATQSIVRAIDSAVIQLFDTAQQSGIDDQGYTGGGITHTGYAAGGGTASKGAAIINITPAGSGWRPLGSTKSFTFSGNTRSDLTPGTMFVEFVPVSGYQTPVNQTIVVVASSTETYAIEFLPSLTPQESWRQVNFGTTANSGSAADSADPDLDGLNNAAEYTAGTNPNSAADVFKVQTAQKSGSTFTLTTAGKNGRTYILERNATLGGTWDTVTTQGPLGSDGTVTLTDLATLAGKAFYRIRVTGP
ncbi:LamG-like jellyroll fold domain-containing protein [Prosthecobacter sp.]|uniref:RCC1 domain-containing protein n=1 Tax=Prosthecobacter sp. TaxID=1965333 RepID=UPI002AB82D5D|nr:LamG-like jellyroll fold domain-containing protein [Prosthecobacter sp.]MDZ4405030.1 LamG-like jellyroll fold domain-containing protein [Prosthecobacter sp.]